MHIEATKCTQRPQSAHRGHIVHTEATKCTQRPHSAHRSHKVHTEATKCTQRPQGAHRGHKVHTEATKCTQRPHISQMGCIEAGGVSVNHPRGQRHRDTEGERVQIGEKGRELECKCRYIHPNPSISFGARGFLRKRRVIHGARHPSEKVKCGKRGTLPPQVRTNPIGFQPAACVCVCVCVFL